MGYTFTIGDAKPKFDKSGFPDLYADWKVEAVARDDAPTFPNDDMTANTNQRSPSYTAWSEFCRGTGIYDLFYDDRGHLRAGHPGCVGITKDDHAQVKAALEARRATATLPPGFEAWNYKGEPRVDAYLARLIWLEWWMRWALENCETPAIANS